MPIVSVATANLLHGMSLRTGEADPAVLGEAMAALSADVVGLQEVDFCQDRSGGTDQTAVAAQAIGATERRFVPTVIGTPGRSGWRGAREADVALAGTPSYGIALVSRLPVLQWSVRRFRAAPVPFPLVLPAVPRARVGLVPDEPRAAIAAVVQTAAGPMTVVTCHLSFVPGVNVWQLRAIASWLRSMPAPRVLLGDLNLPGGLPARVSGLSSLVREATYPSPQPRVQLDHVLGDGQAAGAVRSAGAQLLPVSDHRALRAELELG